MKRWTKKRRIQNQKLIRLFLVLNCLVILAAMLFIFESKNYDSAVACKKFKLDWCNKYELDMWRKNEK